MFHSLQVLEYSELDPATAAAEDPATGKLYYNWSNICMHYFALPWLQAAAQQLQQAAAYHIAHKQIPESRGGKVAGVKLEMFIFDPFHSAKDVTLFEVRTAACSRVDECPMVLPAHSTCCNK
jgi:UDP-N-acetylglucosamine/UDP-N-acetylgalactosamine diphosphorylase